MLTTAQAEGASRSRRSPCQPSDACPIYPGKRYLDWELTDPAGKALDKIRPIRDEIDARVQALLAGLGAAAPADGSP